MSDQLNERLKQINEKRFKPLVDDRELGAKITDSGVIEAEYAPYGAIERNRETLQEVQDPNQNPYMWSNQNRSRPSVQDVVSTSQSVPQAQEAVQEEVGGDKPAKDGLNIDSDLLVGATPALMGILFGNSELGFKIGGQYLTKRAQERQNLDDKLTELQLKQTRGLAGSSRRFQQSNIVDPTTGKTVKAVFDQFTGVYTLPDGNTLSSADIEAGSTLSPFESDRRRELQKEKEIAVGEKFNRGFRIDPLEGEIRSPEQIRQAAFKDKEPGSPTIKQEKDFKEMRTEFKQNKVFQDAEKALGQFSTVNSLIQEARVNNNPVTIRAIQNSIARMSGEVGAMTDQDVETLRGSQAYKDVARRWVREQNQGIKALPEDLEAMQAIVDIYAQKAKNKLGAVYNSSVKQFSKSYGIPESKVLEILGPSIDPLYEMGKRENIVEGTKRIYTKGQRVDGYEFLGGDEADPKNYRKVR